MLAPAGYHVLRPAGVPTRRAGHRRGVHVASLLAGALRRLGPEALDDWWVADHYKNPTWDLIAVCAGETRRGLLLVEAKAHESELDWKGKRALVADTDSAKHG